MTPSDGFIPPTKSVCVPGRTAIRVLLSICAVLVLQDMAVAGEVRDTVRAAVENMKSGSIIMFGSVSCEYCTDEITELLSLRASRRDAGVTVFLEGDAGAVKRACLSRNVDFSCVAISPAALANALRLFGKGTQTPLIVVRGKNGKRTALTGSTNVRRLIQALGEGE